MKKEWEKMVRDRGTDDRVGEKGKNEDKRVEWVWREGN